MNETENNIITRQVVLEAPLPRVWQAISDSAAFGHWFGAEVEGAFEPGARVQARIRPTRVDPDIASQQQPYDGTPFVLLVERVEPMRLLSFRWHPGGMALPPDAPDDETTLVEFRLEEVPAGVRLTIRESGFDRVPLARRAQAIADNTGGWEAQARLVASYLARQPE